MLLAIPFTSSAYFSVKSGQFFTIKSGQFFTLKPTPFSGGLTYQQTIVADVPLIYTRLGESSGATAVDIMLNHDGTYTGTVTYSQTGAISGDANTAVNFGANPGSVGMVDFGSASYAKGLANITLEMWAKTSAGYAGTGQYRSLGEWGNAFGAENGWRIEMDENTGKVRFLVSSVTELDTNSGYSTSAINNGAYHYVTGRYDGAKVSIWVDGVKESETSLTGNLKTDTTNRNIYAADSAVGGLWGFPGTIDEWALYTGTALSDAKILAHYQKGIGL